MRPLLLDVCGRNNLCGDVQPFAEVVKAFGCECVVVPLPRELRLQVIPRRERLAGFDDEEVLGVYLGMLRKVVVFLGHENTLLKEVLVDLLPVCFRNEHLDGTLSAKIPFTGPCS